MQWRSLLLLFFLLVCYLLLGGLVFHLVEVNSHDNCKLEQRLDAILSHHGAVIYGMDVSLGSVEDADEKNASSEDELMKELRSASACMATNATQLPMSFSDGVYFSLTIMSAIGYGYYYPKTLPGKVATIIYSFTAIPLFLLTSAAIGEKMQRAMTTVLTDEVFIKHGILSVRLRLVIKILLLLVVGQTLFLVIPAVGVMYLEEWSYFDSYYFLVVTFLTVGFGDLNVALVVDQPYVEVYRLVYYLWTLLGVSLIALTIQTVVETLKTKTGQLEEKLAKLSQMVQDVGGPPKTSGQYRVRRIDSFMANPEPPNVFKKKASNAFFFGSTTVFGVNPNLKERRRSSAGDSLTALSNSSLNSSSSRRTSKGDPLPTLAEEEEGDREIAIFSLDDGSEVSVFSEASFVEYKM